MKINLGCSSFYNAKWKGVFYPETMAGKDWFAFYCEHFGTFEINATFYKMPTLRVMKNWYDRSPDAFLYSVKAPKSVTHVKRFEDCKQDIDAFYEVCRDGLREKLSCVLFQFPPSFSYSEERLQNILQNLDYGFNNVVEFRHASWWREDVQKLLSDKNVIFCSVSHPNLPSEIISQNGSFYLRLHGVPKMFYSEYPETYLKELADATKNRNGFVYFNNTADTGGILNALRFKELSQ
ncbi:DUF72 domain-containing protein [Flavobacterium sp.]|uniref:DUF72 domain-containing protein n=1 Tax=Flavobacterium sp. TaxID=239 RepID=UPI001226E922|nr:DUF72 domain-containing protein [Flavobacterium sp.]RZJ69227.1 MAG: DUF72 domain-containing protein [Flavobacterium sp.]